MCFKNRMDKYMMVYSYNGITYNNDNEQDIFIGNNVNETYNHNFEQKKPDTKTHMLISLSISIIYLSIIYLPMSIYLPTSLSLMN